MLKKLIGINQQELGNGVLRLETPMKNKGNLLVFSEINIHFILGCRQPISARICVGSCMLTVNLCNTSNMTL